MVMEEMENMLHLWIDQLNIYIEFPINSTVKSKAESTDVTVTVKLSETLENEGGYLA